MGIIASMYMMNLCLQINEDNISLGDLLIIQIKEITNKEEERVVNEELIRS